MSEDLKAASPSSTQLPHHPVCDWPRRSSFHRAHSSPFRVVPGAGKKKSWRATVGTIHRKKRPVVAVPRTANSSTAYPTYLVTQEPNPPNPGILASFLWQKNQAPGTDAEASRPSETMAQPPPSPFLTPQFCFSSGTLRGKVVVAGTAPEEAH